MAFTRSNILHSSSADKHESSVKPTSIEPLQSGEETRASDYRKADSANGSPQKEAKRLIREKKAQLEISETVERHLRWLQTPEVRPWNERATWSPSSFKSEKKIADISWGQTTQSSSPSKQDATLSPIFWDESGSQTFEDALKLQAQDRSDHFSYIELDVQGLDSKGDRLRVRRALEVKLTIATQTREHGLVETTTMQLKRVLTISPLDVFSIPTRAEIEVPYQNLLEQLAQHEVNQALDERNTYLRDVFGQDVDHVRKRRNSTIAAHEWSFQKPETWIRGADGTVIGLREERTDREFDGEVALTYRILIEQIRCDDGRNHLFDLPVEGCESERRIRHARWTISSAISRCIASGSADRFVFDRTAEGVLIPKG
jgi:hypothetical protein